MSESCLECLNKLTRANDPRRKYILSRELDLCEECMQWKPVVIRKRRVYIFSEDLQDWIRYISHKKNQ